MKAIDIALIAICAALYAVIGRLTDFGVTFIGVAFWPAAVIPAIFAALYGPWIGGTGAAIGIFARDMLFHGDPLLSLAAGVPPNFIMFFIIGYISQKKLDSKKLTLGTVIAGIVIVAGLLLPTIIMPSRIRRRDGSINHCDHGSLPLHCRRKPRPHHLRLHAMARMAKLQRRLSNRTRRRSGYPVSAWSGRIANSSSPTGYFKAPLQASLIPAIFIWTFATEIPFVLLAGPPVIKTCYAAFPSLRRTRPTEWRPIIAGSRIADAFAPGGISSFFQICDTTPDGKPITELNRVGARGGGFVIEKGVHTHVETTDAEKTTIQVFINRKPAPEAETTRTVAETLLHKAKTPQEVTIKHEIEIPIGAGFGTSAGGALSTALALSEALGLRFTYNELGRIAHAAEIKCKTGLGTVGPIMLGGCILTVEPGEARNRRRRPHTHHERLFNRGGDIRTHCDKASLVLA